MEIDVWREASPRFQFQTLGDVLALSFYALGKQGGKSRALPEIGLEWADVATPGTGSSGRSLFWNGAPRVPLQCAHSQAQSAVISRLEA